MSVTLNTGLSEEQAKFAVMLEENAPHLLHLWDFNRREYIPALAEKYLSVCSHGEKILAQFYLGVWRSDNYYKFDFVESAKVLDKTQLRVIANWLSNPIFP